MVEVLFPPVTRRARNKNKSEMNRCLPIWLSRPASHQPTSSLEEATQVLMIDPSTLYRKRKRIGLCPATSCRLKSYLANRPIGPSPRASHKPAPLLPNVLLYSHLRFLESRRHGRCF